MLWYVLILVLTIYIYIKLIKPCSYWKKRSIKQLKTWPIIGNMGPTLFGSKSFTELLQDWYSKCNGRYLGVYYFNTPLLLIKDLEIIKRITVKDFDSFIDHNMIVSEKVDPLFGNIFFFLKGNKWRNMRVTFSPAFTGSKMRSMYTLMSECAQNYIKHLKENSDSSPTTEIEVGDIFSRYINDAVATCAFGIECDSIKNKNNEFYVIGKKSLNFDGIRGLLFFLYMISVRLVEFLNIKFVSNEAEEFYRSIVRETMKKREEEGIYRPDMINLLMEAKKGRLKFEESQQDDDVGFATVSESIITKRSTNTEELSESVLTAQALLFFVAGFEAIGVNMKLLSYELALNPDVQTKLQTEIDETFENNKKITYDVIKQMKYLDMVICEVLRKYGGTFVDRVCTKPYTIKAVDPDEEDIHLKVGDVIWIPILSIHSDPEYYPNPTKFDPERFSDENKKNINPYAFIPFGIGPRNCIGNRYALLKIKSFFVHLLRDFSLSVTNKTEIPLKIPKFSLGLRPSNMYLGLNPRS